MNGTRLLSHHIYCSRRCSHTQGSAEQNIIGYSHLCKLAQLNTQPKPLMPMLTAMAQELTMEQTHEWLHVEHALLRSSWVLQVSNDQERDSGEKQ